MMNGVDRRLSPDAAGSPPALEYEPQVAKQSDRLPSVLVDVWLATCAAGVVGGVSDDLLVRQLRFGGTGEAAAVVLATLALAGTVALLRVGHRRRGSGGERDVM